MKKFLGFVLAVVVIVGAVGLWRGWFVVRTVQAGERSALSFEVDRGKIGDDARGVFRRGGELSKEAVDQVKAIARDTTGDQKVVEGTVAVVDVAERNLTVTSGKQQIDVRVPSTVEIRRDGQDVPLSQLAAGQRVSLTFHVADQTWRLQRIELSS